MVPLVGIVNELDNQEVIIRKTANKIFKAEGIEVPFKVGTMIEVPRAALTADLIANKAELFQFGTNDLTPNDFLVIVATILQVSCQVILKRRFWMSIHSRFSIRRVLVSSSRWVLRRVVRHVRTSNVVSVASMVVNQVQLSSATEWA